MYKKDVTRRIMNCLIEGRVDGTHVGDVQGQVGDGDEAAGARG